MDRRWGEGGYLARSVRVCMMVLGGAGEAIQGLGLSVTGRRGQDESRTEIAR